MGDAPVQFDDLTGAFPYLSRTEVVRDAYARARDHSAPFLFNHCVRSWVFAASIGRKGNHAVDGEVVAIATLLHDMALTPVIREPLRFEVAGANAARDFVRTRGFDDIRAQRIWDGIALHGTPDIAVHKEIDVALVARGIGTDFGAPDFASFSGGEIDDILRSAPRCNMKEAFKECLCAEARERPETTYTNFIRDFGERFVPGYQAPSRVDYLMAAPFSE